MSYTNNYRNKTEQSKRMHYSPNMLSCINNALDNTNVVEIEYDSRESGTTNRRVEPMAVMYKNRKRHLIGYCQLREDWRTFRLDRINQLKLLKENFEPRSDFDLFDFEDNFNQNELSEDGDHLPEDEA